LNISIMWAEALSETTRNWSRISTGGLAEVVAKFAHYYVIIIALKSIYTQNMMYKCNQTAHWHKWEIFDGKGGWPAALST